MNDAQLLHNLIATSNKIKGIRGKCVRIAGVGKLSLPLRSNNGDIDIITDLDAVYVPSSPYNLVPPQILIKQMKSRILTVNRFNHDDINYTFSYKPSSLPKDKPPRIITAPQGLLNFSPFVPMKDIQISCHVHHNISVPSKLLLGQVM